MKYNDIIQSMIKSITDFSKFQEDAENIFINLIRKFAEYLEIPLEENTFDNANHLTNLLFPVPIMADSKTINEKSFTPFGAIGYSEYGWATMGLVIVLETNPLTFPKRKYKFDLYLSKNDKGEWIIKHTPDGEKFNLGRAIPIKNEFNPLFDYISEFLNNYLTDGFDLWIRGSDKNIIGFIK